MPSDQPSPVRPWRNPALSETFALGKLSVTIRFGDITHEDVDAIVSSDDTQLLKMGGVARAILNAAGATVVRERLRRVLLALGEAVVTPAGDLKADHIIHAAVIDYDNNIWPDATLVRTATVNSLRAADGLNCHTVAMPALGTGVGGFPPEASATATIDALESVAGELASVRSVHVILNRYDLLVEYVRTAVMWRMRREYEPRLRELEAQRQAIAAELSAISKFKNVPTPIAINRRMIDMHQSYHSKFTAAVETAESIVKFLAAVAMADANQQHIVDKAVVEAFVSHAVSFGSCVTQLGVISNSLASEGSVIGKKVASYWKSRNAAILRKVWRIRNKEYGHGSTLDEATYQAKCASLLPDVDALMLALTEAELGDLLVVESADVLKDTIDYEVLRVMGDNIIYPTSHITSNSLRLRRGTLYLVSGGDYVALPLAPFLVFDECPQCHSREVFFLEELTGTKASYHSYRGNHRRTDITPDKTW